MSLRNELIRQEKLELLAQRFDHKAAMRETWLNENQRLVSQVGGAGGLGGDSPPQREKEGEGTWFWMLGGVGVPGENGGAGVSSWWAPRGPRSCQGLVMANH